MENATSPSFSAELSNLEMAESGFYSDIPKPPEHNNSDIYLPSLLATDDSLYKRIILGYTLPGLIVLTTVLNCFVFTVLVKPSMRTSVNVILAGLSISDTMTGVSALPYYIYFHAVGHDHEYVPHVWCYVQKFSAGIFPTIFHTISVWLTLSLAIQRYIYVCHSLHAKTLCTVNKMARVTVTITILSCLLHAPRLFDSSFVKVVVHTEENGQDVDGCVEILKTWAYKYQDTYYPIYYWIRLIAVQIIPTIGLTFLNMILIAVIRTSSARRRHLILQNRTREWRKIRDTNITTLLLVVVITVFIMVEAPMGILMLCAILKNQYGHQIAYLDQEMQKILTTIFNFLILLSYPLNFIIYVSMSKQFRSHFLTSFRKTSFSKISSGKSLQTYSREKSSSSVELMKSIFTVTAVPLIKERSGPSPTSTMQSNRSSRSSHFSTKTPSLVTVKLADVAMVDHNISTDRCIESSSATCGIGENDAQRVRNCCECQCPICQVECQQNEVKLQTAQMNISVYSDDL